MTTFYIISVLILLCLGLISSIMASKKRKKACLQLGFNFSDLIDTGKYTYGHPDLDKPIEPTYMRVIDGKIEIYSIKNNTLPYLAGTVPVEKITDITIEDASTIERRVTAARMLMVGVFAFALKKKKKEELSYLVIEWSDGKYKHATMFEFIKRGAMERSNKARNALIRLTK